MYLNPFNVFGPGFAHNPTDLLDINTWKKASTLELIIAKENSMQILILKDVWESDAPKVPQAHVKTF